jgi:peptidoglycan hydrolase-like protein with peptidoglycan-binding domain
MSKRNVILLIIILIIATIFVFGFLYFRQGTETPGDSTGTNFFSQFNPFGSGTPRPGTETPPTDVSGYEPPTETSKLQLRKISSMPIAGFAVYQKERLKDVPLVEIPVVEPSLGTPYDFGTNTIKNGSTGEGVKELQRFLNTTLKINLELSGKVDTETINAIKTWQTDNEITSDGVVGPKTKIAMYASVNQNTGTTEPTPPPTEFAPALRYVDRANGNIYQTFADKVDERKFSDTVVPKVYEAFFGNKGDSVVMRYLKADGKTIESFVGTLPKEFLGADTTDTNEVKINILPDDIKDVSFSSDAEKMFYMFNVGENMVGTTLDFFTNKKTQVFDSAFTEWLSQWPNDNLVTVTTKPSALVPGYMYSVNPNSISKSLNKVLGGVNGLTTLTSPDGKLVLYGNNNLSLSLYHTDTKNTETIGVKTLPEKCVWGRANDAIYCAVPKTASGSNFPDTWYQGEVSFEDQIWKIDLVVGNTTLIADPAALEGGEEVDAIKLATDEGENYLFFVNKKDSYLWELKIK